MKTGIQSKLIFTFSLIVMSSVFSAAHARGIEEMIDPVELFYSDPGKISKSQAKALVSDAINGSSRPRWTERSGRRGSIRAEAERRRLFAAIDIEVGDESIKIHYVDSERMRFRERRGKKYIRDIYNKWVASLAKNMNREAKNKYKIQLVSSKKRKLLKGLASGKNLVVIAVRALPDVRPVRNGPKWSAQIGESMAEVLTEKYGAKHVFSTLEWNRENLNLVKSGYKPGYNRQACDDNGAQGVITVGVVIDSTDTDGSSASEEVALTYFNCDKEKLIVKTVRADYKNTDAFDLQTGINSHINKVLAEAGL